MKILRGIPTLVSMLCLALVLWYRPAFYGAIVFAIVGSYVFGGTILWILLSSEETKRTQEERS